MSDAPQGYDAFALAVRGYWRTGHADTSDGTLKLLWTMLSRYAITDVLQAVTAHKRENIDAMKPLWKDVFVRLHKQAGSASVLNEFESFLEHTVRGGLERHARLHPDWWKNRTPPSKFTRADLWQNWLDAQAADIQESTLGMRHKDEDGHRAEAAHAMREREAACWLLYYDGLGTPPPPWLRGE